MTAIKPVHLAVAVALGAAGWLAFTATRNTGPVGDRQQRALTELEAPVQDFREHLAHITELVQPVFTAHRFPDRTCPGTNEVIHNGFTARYAPQDPQLAALPAEQAW
jgi:hypothetical protein